MRKPYFFLLSGEYETLPAAELRSTLKVLDPGHEIIGLVSGRIALIKTSEAAARAAIRRTAYTKLCGKLAAETSTNEEAILKAFDADVLGEILLPDASSFMVRGKRIQGAKIDVSKLEKEIGARILALKPELKVDLTNPDITVFFLSAVESTFIGLLVDVKPKKFFADRLAGKRPFSLPSAMQPDFSRAMVNLAEVNLGGRILDPFAGTGGIMIEAGVLGYDVYGVEFKGWIAGGGLKNLKRYLLGREIMITGDARSLMFREECFDAIVTDPPYGRSTTVPDESIHTLLSKFFNEGLRVLKERRRIVMAVPLNVPLERIVSEHGLKIIEKHVARVHGSLTRKVVVLEK